MAVLLANGTESAACGAVSIDKAFRAEGISWWPEEVPSLQERGEAYDNLEKRGWKVDYVITHCPPTKMLLQMPRVSHNCDEYSNWLQMIADVLDFKGWFFGHMHEDVDFPADERFHALYYDFYSLEAGERATDLE